MRHAPRGNSVIGHDRLLMHMVQHVLLGAVAPPLVWLIARRLPLSFELPEWARTALTPLGRLVTHPVTTWLAGTMTVIAWHVPAAFELGQRSEMWRAIQMGSFFVTGLLFWWPVVRPFDNRPVAADARVRPYDRAARWLADERLPRDLIPVYLFTATLPCDALSAFLVFCGRVVYRHQDLADQQAAGAFMWVSITFLYLIPAIVMTVRALSPAQPDFDR
jgi:putative membrane protein